METMRTKDLAVRWTIGDVTDFGFEALQLSVWGAYRLFGPQASYVVCVNTISIAEARERTGHLPLNVQWLDASNMLPAFLKEHYECGMAEGVAWKLVPVRLFPDKYVLSMDNDVILWRLPKAVRLWLEADLPGASLIAEDVTHAFGQFAHLCGEHPRNSGIRGVSPGFDYEQVLRKVLEREAVTLKSEVDEQGLQVAALCETTQPFVVSVNEVTICSPFWPHRNYLGTCGAHFVGLNTKHLPWDYYDRPADDWKADHWTKFRPIIEKLVVPHAVFCPHMDTDAGVRSLASAIRTYPEC